VAIVVLLVNKGHKALQVAERLRRPPHKGLRAKDVLEHDKHAHSAWVGQSIM
jgi:hypothetical protein